MPKPGSILMINSEPYEVVGDVRLSWDSGDSTESIDLSGLRRQRDGRPYYFCNEKLQPEIFTVLPDYQAANWAPVTPPKEVTSHDQAFRALPSGEVLLTRFQAAEGPVAGDSEPPLQGVHKLLTLATSATAPATLLAGRDLIAVAAADQPLSATSYVTDDTPAAALPRMEVARRATGHPIWRYLSYLLVLGLAAMVFLDPEAGHHPRLDFVTLCWYLGLGSITALVVLRSFPIRLVFHLVAAGFLLHLHTLFVDHVIAAGSTLPPGTCRATGWRRSSPPWLSSMSPFPAGTASFPTRPCSAAPWCSSSTASASASGP